MIGFIKLIREIELVAIVYEPKKIDMQDWFSKQTYQLFPVNSKKELAEACNKLKALSEYAVMYNFGIIVPQEVVDKLCIFNFHAGDLRMNRGSSPINWSILLGEKYTSMTLYKITEEIDSGDIVCEHRCKIYRHDVVPTVRARMEGEIPSMLMDLYQYISQGNHSICSVTNGTYRPRLSESDFIINSDDDEDVIKSKIRSQYEFKGAIVIDDTGNKEYVRSYDEYLVIINRKA